MLKSNWFETSDAYMLMKGTIIITGEEDDTAAQ